MLVPVLEIEIILIDISHEPSDPYPPMKRSTQRRWIEIITLSATAVGSVAAVFQWPEFRRRVLHDPEYEPPPTATSGVVDSLRPRPPSPLPHQRRSAGDWFEVRSTNARASSTLPPSRVAAYDPGRVTDGSWSTVWVEGAAGDGVGEWIEIGLGRSVTVSKLGVVNGYGKGVRYLENGRVRDAVLEFSDGSTQGIHLADNNEMQYFDLRPVSTSTMRLTIRSVYPGTRWDDTAVGELRLWARD